MLPTALVHPIGRFPPPDDQAHHLRVELFHVLGPPGGPHGAAGEGSADHSVHVDRKRHRHSASGVRPPAEVDSVLLGIAGEPDGHGQGQ